MRVYFQSEPVTGVPVGAVDRDHGIIRGITVARIGPAKGHDALIDKEFLLQVVDSAAKRPKGIKARFGHPNMCSTALGTYLGRFKNYSYLGDAVKADLFLDESSKTAPSGNLYEYVLGMAETNPDMFGASLAFESTQFHEVSELENDKPVRKRFFRLKELRATDIVDEPAATDGLFSAESLPGLASRFLDENPQLAELIFSKPDRVIEFLNNYLNNNTMNFSDHVKSNFRKLFGLESSINLPEIPEHPSDDVLSIPSDESGAGPPASIVANPPEAPPALAVNPDVDTALDQPFVLIDSMFENFLSIAPLPSVVKLDDGSYQLKGEAPEDDCILNAGGKLVLILATLTERQDKLNESRAEVTQLKSEIETLTGQIQELTDKLAAKPTLPNSVSDPGVEVSTSAGQPADETGKIILQNIPQDLKFKVKNASKK